MSESERPLRPPSLATIATRIALIYAFVGALWILFSDLAVRQLFGEQVEKLTLVQTLKGWFFILATAVLLYLLIRRGVRHMARTEAALRGSEATLSKAQSVAHLGSWEWEPGTGRVTWSQEQYRIFGVDPADFKPTFERVMEMMHPDDRPHVLRTVEDALQGGACPFSLEHRIVRPDGSIRVLASGGDSITDARGRVVRMIGTALDITERKEAEDKLRHLNETLEQRVRERTAQLAEAVEDLRAFSYTVSHDLRTPLRTIRRFAQAVLERPESGADPLVSDHARRIIAAATRMEQLTSEILDYSQIARQDLVLQRISVVLVLHDVVGQLKRTPSFADADVIIREPMPWVRAHRATLATVFAALLTNAAMFVAPGVRPRIEILAEDRGRIARVWFIDNGIGIPPEDQQRVFGLFERLHDPERFPGTGVGLAIARRGVERMGGQIGVESAACGGSRFWVDLPRDPESP